MSEQRPAEPYNADYFTEWCNHHGIDNAPYPGLSYGNFKVARESGRDVSLAFKLRQEIEKSLPLEDCEIVPHPKAMLGERQRPRVYQAPEGFAFAMTTRETYYPTDDFGDPTGEEPRIVEYSMTGTLLEIETSAYRGVPKGRIIVREAPVYKAAPIADRRGLADDNAVVFPSKYDPEKPGAHVSFWLHDGWDLYMEGGKLEGDYTNSEVHLVSYEKPQSTELYQANFRTREAFALDDFRYYPEAPLLPPGYVALPHADGTFDIAPTLSQLILPPLHKDVWSELWYNHGIMIKVNPTAGDERSIRLDTSSHSKLNLDVRTLNRRQRIGSTFLRVIAVRGDMSLEGVLRGLSTTEELSDDEAKRFGQF